MDIQSPQESCNTGHTESEKRPRQFPFLILILIAVCGISLWACTEEGVSIGEPGQAGYVYEAKEKFVLRAIAQIFAENHLGRANIDADAHEVTSEYIVQGDWRTRGLARVRQINWKECEVKLTIITEKKTPTGWEMRRLLGKDQYEKIFKAIEFQIYREMYKTK